MDKNNSARKISIEIETRFYLRDKKKMFVIEYHQDLQIYDENTMTYGIQIQIATFNNSNVLSSH